MSLRPNARTEVRRNRYKVAVDADEGCRRREDNMVEIRKSKREESLLKKPREGIQSQPTPFQASTVDNKILLKKRGIQSQPTPFQASTVDNKLESLPALVKGVWSDDRNLQLEATTQFRQLLSIGNCVDFLQAVIEAGLIAPLVNLLQNAEFDIRKEAAWAISNATSGGTHDQIKYLVSQGCIKPLCDLLVCRDPKIVTVCLEGLENIQKVGEADKIDFLDEVTASSVDCQNMGDAPKSHARGTTISYVRLRDGSLVLSVDSKGTYKDGVDIEGLPVYKEIDCDIPKFYPATSRVLVIGCGTVYMLRKTREALERILTGEESVYTVAKEITDTLRRRKYRESFGCLIAGPNKNNKLRLYYVNHTFDDELRSPPVTTMEKILSETFGIGSGGIYAKQSLDDALRRLGGMMTPQRAIMQARAAIEFASRHDDFTGRTIHVFHVSETYGISHY